MTLNTLKKMSLIVRAQVFVAWLKSQPIGATYLPGSRSNCALAQFARTMGWNAGGLYTIGAQVGDGSNHMDILPRYVPIEGWTDRVGASENGANPPQTFHGFANHIEYHLNAVIK